MASQDAHPLGTLSVLPSEMRESIWSFVSSDTLILHNAPASATTWIPLLHCSKLLRQELVTAIKHDIRGKLRSPEALTQLISSGITLPRLMRLRFFINTNIHRYTRQFHPNGEFNTSRTSTTKASDKAARIANISAWNTSLLRLPKATHAQTLVLDLHQYTEKREDFPFLEFWQFVRRLATREQIKTKGRCDIVVDAPMSLLELLFSGRGAPKWVAPYRRVGKDFYLQPIQINDWGASEWRGERGVLRARGSGGS
ncbi:hypothetical protein CC86DRAFT_58613 [Ophiobolus disseminans]|uniref:F-box domain-containing protein n=1 Tax=Ophiobolus disseminans TaxID=1469910 RepID=A0A6A6ZSC9_9PLEO|nr:hypothetical protein CC86DRAFT_58613 [Ophiobolus disseminans]